MIKAIVFDIGGVLEITPRTGWVERWEQQLGLAADSINQQLHDLWLGGSIGTISEQVVEAGIAERLGLDSSQLAAFLADLWAEYLGKLNAELAEFFASLRPRYTTAILSNSFVGARQREQAAYGFEDICDLIIYSHEEGLKKPDPAFYRLACERLKVQPHEMIFLDDIDVVVEAARNLGIKAIHYHSNQQAIAEIQALLAAA
ncbi:HAD family phosphatase [Herpetosiphon gulosus]|uniref:Hydrolase n=1 Tax=Herpetosiphon gulosus TaxID=1973496 RepID=A0ABP9WT48_9CHLR